MRRVNVKGCSVRVVFMVPWIGRNVREVAMSTGQYSPYWMTASQWFQWLENQPDA